MPAFELTQTVAGNVRALRTALGSAVRPLSLQDLARLIAEEHPDKRSLNATTVRRWEAGEGEPDLYSLRIMARLAGVGLEQFAFGGGTIHSASERVKEPPLEAFVPVQARSKHKKSRPA